MMPTPILRLLSPVLQSKLLKERNFWCELPSGVMGRTVRIPSRFQSLRQGVHGMHVVVRSSAFVMGPSDSEVIRRNFRTTQKICGDRAVAGNANRVKLFSCVSETNGYPKPIATLDPPHQQQLQYVPMESRQGLTS